VTAPACRLRPPDLSRQLSVFIRSIVDPARRLLNRLAADSSAIQEYASLLNKSP
jgi:hypothetical protein